MSNEFTASPAVRTAQTLIVGLTGASSSGKTWTALELAKGMQSVVGGEIAMIDTENKRGLAYADAFRNKDGSPGFLHIPFEPPWSSLRYVAAMEFARTKARTIIVDSMSHEHEGEGGMIDFQEQEVTRMAGQDFAKRERVKMLAWAKPKAARRTLLRTISRLDANLILCFRAKNTSKPGKDGQGKSVVIPMGFVPIAGDEFVFEAALSALFLPGAQGVPTWHSEFPGERMAIKVPRQFEFLRERDGPLNFETGRLLAEWARGGRPGAAAPTQAPPREPAQDTPPARGNQQSEPQPTEYVLLTATETHRFTSEGEYLAAYRRIVDGMYSGGKQSELLRFDQANRQHIDAAGLKEAVAAVNAEIRRPAGGLNL